MTLFYFEKYRKRWTGILTSTKKKKFLKKIFASSCQILIESISLNRESNQNYFPNRYTSSLHYDSDRHFIQAVSLQPKGQALQHCRQTVVAVPHSTWRHYKTQLEFQPRHRLQNFKSTTIIYPKKTSVVFATELSYDSHRLARRFLSSVELEAVGQRELPQWEWDCAVCAPGKGSRDLSIL